jgi:phosphatidyl-myo-inositol alpha-mannosyltransferase
MNASMRVGLVCPYSFGSPGGVQSHVVGLARFLTAAGHHVRILAPGELAGDSGLHSAQFSTAGSAIPVPYNGSVARINIGPASAARVRRWLRQGTFDVVHIHEPITPSISLLALWAAQVPVVATFHTATPRSRSMGLAGDVLRTVIDKIAIGIAVSESARRVVMQYLARDPQVIPNGFRFLDFAEHAGAPRVVGPWRGGPSPRLSFLGRGDERRKGLAILLDALPMIKARYPQLDVAIAGECTARSPNGARNLGSLTDRAKVDLLTTTDVFVAPQLARESFGIVLLEAMASAAPVVASDLEPFLDLLRPGGSAPLGETFPRGDARALADAAIRVLDAPDHARTQRARLASRSFDWSVVGPQILETYCTVRGRDMRPRVRPPTALTSSGSAG